MNAVMSLPGEKRGKLRITSFETKPLSQHLAELRLYDRLLYGPLIDENDGMK